MNPDKKRFVNDLYLFYRYFIASHYPNSVPAPHIQELALKLMELKEGAGKSRLAVSMPPSAFEEFYGHFGVPVMVNISES